MQVMNKSQARHEQHREKDTIGDHFQEREAMYHKKDRFRYQKRVFKKIRSRRN